MFTKYVLRIPEPCNEKWENMTPTPNGRFCHVCEREILDFTQLSHRELAQKLDNNENICGRFLDSQLNVDLYSLKHKKVKDAGILLTLTSIMAATLPTFAQKDTISTQIENRSDYKTDTAFINKVKNLPNSVLVEGIVKESVTNEPIPFVSVYQKGIKIEVITDFEGHFKIYTNKKHPEDTVILRIGTLGYESQEIVLKPGVTKLNVTMKEAPPKFTTGIVVKERKTPFQGIKTGFQRFKEGLKRLFRGKKHR